MAASDYDLAYQYLTLPAATVVARLLPMGKVHPNAVSFLAFALLTAGNAFFILSPGQLSQVTLGCVILAYNVLDALDGIVARREKVPSCEGEMVDHLVDGFVGCKSVCLLGLLSADVRMGLIGLTFGQTVFYLAHLNHLLDDKGTPLLQRAGPVGTDAAEIFGGLLFIISAYHPFSPDQVFVIAVLMGLIGSSAFLFEIARKLVANPHKAARLRGQFQFYFVFIGVLLAVFLHHPHCQEGRTTVALSFFFVTEAYAMTQLHQILYCTFQHQLRDAFCATHRARYGFLNLAVGLSQLLYVAALVGASSNGLHHLTLYINAAAVVWFHMLAYGIFADLHAHRPRLKSA